MIPEIQNMYRDNKSIYLGEINEWSLQTQETAYINNHVCFFASTGDVASYDNRELKLMNINVEQGVMSEVFSEKGGFPYCTIEKRNDSAESVPERTAPIVFSWFSHHLSRKILSL